MDCYHRRVIFYLLWETICQPRKSAHSQLRRPEGGMNSKPTMLDLKESGDIENHSHVVLLPFLPVGDDGGPKPEEQLLIIGKNRNGRIGSLPVYFDEKRLQFCERDRAANRD
jgi:replicative DNA helicase